MQLTIPAQDSETRGNRIKPREVREWLENLPCLDLQRATRLVNEQLRLMNRQVVTPSARLEILGAFLGTYYRLLESLPPNESDATKIQPLLKQLSQNIGFGYKIVVHQLANKKRGLLESRHLPAALLGAIYSLGLQLVHYYEGYQRAPQALWNECLAIYRYALHIERASWRGDLPNVGAIGIDEAFRLTALLRLADPYRLPGGAVRGLKTYFHARIGLTAIETDPATAERESCLPLPRTGHTVDGADKAPLFLNQKALTERMAADIGKLEQYKSPRALELPDLIPAPVLASALERVLRHWEANATRGTKREGTVARIELVSGLDAAYYVLNRGRPFDPGLFLAPGHDDVIDIGSRAAPEHRPSEQGTELLRCNSVDRSDGGVRVSYRGNDSPKPHTGQLFALRRATPSGAPWVIAVSRWLEASESLAGFDAGLQYLAREPEAVVIRPQDSPGLNGEFQPAIAATQKRGEQRVHTLIARGNQIKAGSEFVVYARDGQRQARCTELLESGHGFDRFIYQLLP